MENDINLYVNLTQKKKQQRIAEETREKEIKNRAWLIASLLSWGILAIYVLHLYFRWVLKI